MSRYLSLDGRIAPIEHGVDGLPSSLLPIALAMAKYRFGPAPVKRRCPLCIIVRLACLLLASAMFGEPGPARGELLLLNPPSR